MAYQQDRVYRLTLGDYKSGKGVQLGCVVIDGKIDYSSPMLQIRFDISKTADNKRNGNSASIDVFNLSDTTLDKLQSDFISCVLEVGYVGEDPQKPNLIQIVKGNVTELKTLKQGNDKITQIIMGEGYTDLNHTKLKFTVPAGKTRKEVLTDLVKQIPGTSMGAITGTNLNNPVLDGYPIWGTPKDTLNELTEAWGLEWRQTNGVLEISDESGLVNKNKGEAPLISPTSGLIDIPFYTSAEPTKMKGDKSRREGLQFKALLDANLKPGQLVRVESSKIKGWYRINSARYTGDFRGNDWYVEALCGIITEDDLK
jgi:hypothetical protein